jgi:methionyl-tRNA synthetase
MEPKRFFILEGFRPDKETQEWFSKREREIEHRRDVQGDCPCGYGANSRCEVCGGPACDSKWDAEDPAIFCCLCLDGSLT